MRRSAAEFARSLPRWLVCGSVTCTFGIASAAAAESIDIVGSNEQIAAAGTALAHPSTVRIKDGKGSTREGVKVNFAVIDGRRTLSRRDAVSDREGTASSLLTLGAEAGTHNVRATIGNGATVLFKAKAKAGPPVRLRLVAAVNHAQTHTAVPVTAIVEDAEGNRVEDAKAQVTFSAYGVSGAFDPGSAVAVTKGAAASQFVALSPGKATIGASGSGLASAVTTLTIADEAQPGASSQSLFTTQTPVKPRSSDGSPYELGMKFRLARAGHITAIRYWKSPKDTVGHTGRIWSDTGMLLASATFDDESASGWQVQPLPTPLRVQAGTTYIVSVNAGRYYPSSMDALASPVVNADITAVADGSNGVFGYPGAYPTSTYRDSNYFRDIVFAPDERNLAMLQKLGGDYQNGSAHAALAHPLVVQVRDAGNNPLPGVAVKFALRAGNGSITPATVTSDAAGQARTTLTLGSARLTTVTASALGAGTAAFTASVGNAVFLENQQPGTTAWQMSNPVSVAAPEIAGFAAATSVNKGGALPFKISLLRAGEYDIEIFRLGYYGGAGGRLMARFGPLRGLKQPPCTVTDRATALIECKWQTSFTLQTAADWTSGLYLANLNDRSSRRQSQIWFVVRDDSSRADLLFQSSFTTFQAYNNYGDAERRSLYNFNSTDTKKALKVSFDRPFGAVTSDPERYDKLTGYERNVARWLESQGYDVTYVTNLDVHAKPARLTRHKAFLSVGHDEYWSLEMRNGVEAARDAGTNVAFFGANTAYWRVRFEPSSAGEPDRVMVCYKYSDVTVDPIAPTYLWRGPENKRPENALIGVMYVGDNVRDRLAGFDYVVVNAADPYYRNTGFSEQARATKLVGYEWDAVVDNGLTPSGLVVLAHSPTRPEEIAPGLLDTALASVSNAARYTAPSGAKVFASGSIQFAWGVDSGDVKNPRPDPRIKQFVINILGDMGAQPLTPDAGMIVPR